MRRLTLLVLVLAGIYAGYWFVGARAVENGAQALLADLVADGWQIGTTTADTRGFPSRFDTTFSDVALTAPDGALQYQTPFWQVFALSYRPTDVIVVAAPTHKLQVGDQTITVETLGLRASGAVAANTDLSFDNMTLEAKSIGLSADLGVSLTGRDLLVAMRPAATADTDYDVFARLNDIATPGTAQPISLLSVDATTTLTQRLDRHINGNHPPQITDIVVKSLSLDWGGGMLRGEGTLTVDPNGFLAGTLNLDITEHGALIAQLAALGVIDPGVAPTWVNMGDAMANGQSKLALPLRMQNGAMSVGPFPVGAAPRLR